MKVKFSHDPQAKTLTIRAKIPDWLHLNPSYVKNAVVWTTLRDFVNQNDLYHEVMTEDEVTQDDELFFEAMDSHSDEDWGAYYLHRADAQFKMTSDLGAALEKAIQAHCDGESPVVPVLVNNYAVTFNFS